MLIVKKEAKKLPHSKVSLNITASKDSIQLIYEKILKDYIQKVKMDGFRQGKVPAELIKTRYKSAIEEKLLEDVINKAFTEAILDLEEKPLRFSPPQVSSKESIILGEDFNFQIQYDIFPKVEVEEYKGIQVKIPKVTITESDVEHELQHLQERYASVMEKDENLPCEKGDVVTVSFEELDHEGQPISSTRREDFTFTLGTAQNVYHFDEEIWGLKKGEKLSFKKTYPHDESLGELSGLTKEIQVEVKKIQKRDLPDLNDEFAQDISDQFQTLDDLKAHIKKEMENQLQEKILQDKLNQVLDFIIEKSPFEVPESMLDWQIEEQWKSVTQQSGMNTQDAQRTFQASKENLKKTWKDPLTRSLKQQIILETLLEREKIDVTEEDLKQEFTRQAQLYKMKEDEIEKYFHSQNLVDTLKSEMKLQRVKKLIIDSVSDKIEKEIDYHTYIGHHH